MKHKEKTKQAKNTPVRPMKNSRTALVIDIALRIAVLLILIRACFRLDFQSVFYCVLTLALLILPSVFEHNFGVDLPSGLEIIISLFIFAAEILGELGCYYVRYTFWDTMLHTVNGFVCAAFGFALLDIINRNPKIKFQLSPFYLSVVAFCFSMTIGVLWEFFEFGCDMLLKTDMQKDTIVHLISSVKLDATNSNTPVVISGITDAVVNGKSLGLGGYLDIGLIDTMKDLMVNFIGALVFSIVGYFYIKNQGGSKFAGKFIPVLFESELPQQEEKTNETNKTSKTKNESDSGRPSDFDACRLRYDAKERRTDYNGADEGSARIDQHRGTFRPDRNGNGKPDAGK